MASEFLGLLEWAAVLCWSAFGLDWDGEGVKDEEDSGSITRACIWCHALSAHFIGICSSGSSSDRGDGRLFLSRTCEQLSSLPTATVPPSQRQGLDTFQKFYKSMSRWIGNGKSSVAFFLVLTARMVLYGTSESRCELEEGALLGCVSLSSIDSSSPRASYGSGLLRRRIASDEQPRYVTASRSSSSYSQDPKRDLASLSLARTAAPWIRTKDTVLLPASPRCRTRR